MSERLTQGEKNIATKKALYQMLSGLSTTEPILRGLLHAIRNTIKEVHKDVVGSLLGDSTIMETYDREKLEAERQRRPFSYANVVSDDVFFHPRLLDELVRRVRADIERLGVKYINDTGLHGKAGIGPMAVEHLIETRLSELAKQLAYDSPS